MGLYMFVNDNDRISKRKVSDPFVNEAFQAALQCDPSLMIEEHFHNRKVNSRFFRKNVLENITYSVYQETPAHDGSAYQARLQGSGSGDKKTVIAYLHGIVNGVNHSKSL